MIEFSIHRFSSNSSVTILRKNVFIILLFFICSFSAAGEIRLPEMIGNGMILQRNMPVKIWGWANIGEKVVLNFKNQSFECFASNSGKWQILLPPQEAGGPFQMDFIASNRIKLKNILFGDVWLCAGQSNMEYPFSRLTDRYAKEIRECKNSKIRQFKIPQKYNFNKPEDDYESGDWQEVNPQNILNFSAVAYFSAKELFDKYGIPIGIINASLGGSAAESWMSAEALTCFPEYLAEASKYKDPLFINNIQNKEQRDIAEWYENLNKMDKGLSASPSWKDPKLDDSMWPLMSVPGYWADQELGPVNGVVWFRRNFQVSKPMDGRPARLFMGRIVDADSVFINGVLVGSTSYQYPQRTYNVPADVLVSGKNSIVVRLINNSGKGGFVKEKPYQLFTKEDTVKLNGLWKYQLGCSMKPTPSQTFVRWKPTGLYNGMMAPSNNYGIKGVIWYQGESNAGRPKEYQQLLSTLIQNWRQERDQGNFPFIIVQLPNFMESKEYPAESKWAELRFAQFKTAQTTVNSAFTVNIDLGDWNDIHPQNKLEVAKRIALAAESLAYDEKERVCFGPLFKSVSVKNGKFVISFDQCGTGLITNDNKALSAFAIAGPDGKYLWANAEIRGNKVIVWNDSVSNPLSVRYAWADNPVGANLYNKEGLPASPFEATR